MVVVPICGKNVFCGEIIQSQMADVFTIWMAGFYEGEGSVSNDISNGNRLRLSISQNDVTPLLKAQEKWGGSIRARERVTLTGKISYGNEWRLCHNDAIKFLDDIKPYLIIPYKISQINNAIQKSQEKLDRRFKCNYCVNTYANPSARRRHEKQIHIVPDSSNPLLDNDIIG